MRFRTIGAVFNALFGVGEIASACRTQGVQRAVAKGAVEGFTLEKRMTGIVRALFIGKHALVLHNHPS